ncbi:MAG: DUF4065 domain-containing protein [Acidobacteria bacterium]|nr:MAG: DUF4065 domain-containing protein [Acidobacteriota bacterium]
MTYDSRAVANRFLKLAHDHTVGISPMKLLKLVYFAHGWNLALTGEPLISELVEAWEYGPVVRTLYFEFRRFGDKPIGQPASILSAFEIPECDAEHDYTRRLLNRIWDAYGRFTAIQLSTMSHDPGGPWSMARQHNPGVKSPVIPNEQIRDYFAKQLTA